MKFVCTQDVFLRVRLILSNANISFFNQTFWKKFNSVKFIMNICFINTNMIVKMHVIVIKNVLTLIARRGNETKLIRIKFPLIRETYPDTR